MLLLAIVLVASYLVGALPFGYLIARGVGGIDIRQHGSGNIGATNVARVLGWPFFALVFILDFAKGAAPVLLAPLVTGDLRSASAGWVGRDEVATLAGLAALVGHLWPIYLGFRGGKGVATTGGVISMLAPIPALAGLAAWLLVLLLTRYVSASSIAAALTLGIARLVETWPEPFARQNRTITILCIVAAVLLILRHRANLKRLWLGTEPKVGQRLAEPREKDDDGQQGPLTPPTPEASA